MKYVVPNLEQLPAFAEKFATELYPKGGVFGLTGPLGAGKSTFVRAVIGVLARKNHVEIPRVTSPSFVLHQRYALGSQTVDHFDLYRLNRLDAASAIEIGYFEAAERASTQGFLFVEWPERSTPEVLQLTSEVRIEVGKSGERTFIFNYNPS